MGWRFWRRLGLERIHDLLSGWYAWRPAADGDQFTAPSRPDDLEADDFRLSPFRSSPRAGLFRFPVRGKPRRPFLAEQGGCTEIPSRSLRRDLVNGQSVTFAHGRVIAPDQVLGPERAGHAFVQSATPADG